MNIKIIKLLNIQLGSNIILKVIIRITYHGISKNAYLSNKYIASKNII